MSEGMKRVLIIDALNAYLRAYIVDPSLSTNGQPIGGLKGFIKILQKLVRETRPDNIIIAWDGPDGSRKRKTMDKNYKAGRKPIRLNRAIRNLTEDEELANKMWQQKRIIEYMNEMPIIQVLIAQIEADDVISYVTQMEHYKGWQKIIVSNDRDFMQLCDDETVLWRPTVNEMLNANRIVETIGVHPRNMALARAMAGDASDNLPGIKGAGLKTIQKRLPFLSEDRDCTIPEVMDYCVKSKKGSRVQFFDNVVENKKLVEHNYKMMQLYAPQMSVQAKQFTQEAVENFECDFNRTELIRMMREDGFGELNWEDLKSQLNKINYECVDNASK
jgi:5'-3' exonuclease